MKVVLKKDMFNIPNNPDEGGHRLYALTAGFSEGNATVHFDMPVIVRTGDIVSLEVTADGRLVVATAAIERNEP